MISSLKFHEFLRTRVPWGLARLYYAVPARLGRWLRRLRYRQPPRTGWGQGWRVLVFRQVPAGNELHVMAPVSGLEFDFELLRGQVRGEVRPEHAHRDGVRTADMAWGGHHIYVVNDEIGAQRIPMGKLIPGEFRGGVLNVGLILIDVRDPTSGEGRS
ncbi:MAG: hypothetical protein KJ690_04055 [Alphaproteobacteria bacterium]|nr:hypothetical protein [Alphaproteobacteria bacterium]